MPTDTPPPTAADQAVVPVTPEFSPPVARSGPLSTPEVPRVSPEHVFDGLSLHSLTASQQALLMAAVTPELLDVKPTGEVFLSQVHYRRILNTAFGPGAWGAMPIEQVIKQDNSLIQKFALYVNGKCVAVTFGEQKYYPNGRMTWATTWESAKSNAVMRACKDLGVASECWDRRFTAHFLREHCVRVVVRTKKQGQEREEIQWRRADGEKLTGECKVLEAGKVESGIRPPRQKTDTDPAPHVDAEVVDPADDDMAQKLRESIRQAGGDPDAPEGSGRQPGEDDAPPIPPLITPDQRRRLWAVANRMKVTSAQLHAALLKKGVHSVNDIPAAKVEAVIRWLEGRDHRGAPPVD